MTDKSLNLIEELVLLALDDEKGAFSSKSLAFNYGIAGSVILELSLSEKIEVRDKKVVIKNRKACGDKVVDVYFDKILNSKKDRSLEYWINYIGDRANSVIKETIDSLIIKGILTKKEKKVLWIFTVKRYPALNQKPENSLRKRLSDIVERNREPQVNDLMLLSLIDACDLNIEVFGKVTYNLHKLKVKSIIENSKDSSLINSTIKEIHDLLMAAIIVSITTSTIVASTGK
ncbi:MAG: GPP34 family phosphoprotein [Bacteroidota bacterium]